jgi:hypothetical protein
MNFLIDFAGWCSGEHSIQPVLHMVKILIGVIRIVVPIGLIIMTTVDITKKVINPDDKDGQKKIMTRAIAALIVFLIPTFLNFFTWIVDRSTGVDMQDPGDASLSSCWKNA